jgi:hypothetical protein
MTVALHRVALPGTPPSCSGEYCGVVIYLSCLKLAACALSQLRALPAPFVDPVFSDGSAVDPDLTHGGWLLWWALEWLTAPRVPSPLNVWGQGRYGLREHLA